MVGGPSFHTRSRASLASSGTSTRMPTLASDRTWKLMEFTGSPSSAAMSVERAWPSTLTIARMRPLSGCDIAFIIAGLAA